VNIIAVGISCTILAGGSPQLSTRALQDCDEIEVHERIKGRD